MTLELMKLDRQISREMDYIFQQLEGKGWLPTQEIVRMVQQKYPGWSYTMIKRSLHRLEKRKFVDRLEVFDREHKVTRNPAGWCIIWRRIPNE